MVSDLDFVEYVVGQFDKTCAITYKKMFGEFGLYSDGKFFGMICDDRPFMKPTAGGRVFNRERGRRATLSRGQAKSAD